MEDRPMMTTFTMQHHQPLTPVSPLLPTTLPHVCEPIPQLPMTPPDADEELDAASNAAALRMGVHVLATEEDGLRSLKELLQNGPVAQEGFMNAVNIISKTIQRSAKIIVTGVGKSGKIGEKLVATLNSFGIHSVFLNPTEALHGDLGIIGQHDVLLLLTYSGRTPELLQLLNHIQHSIPLIAITSHIHPSTCPLFNNRPASNCILLPAPIPVSETVSFGLAAPTTSTTTALALSDALALAVAHRLHCSPADVFHAYHPGGAIGAHVLKAGPQRMANIATMVADIPIAQKQSRRSSHASSLTALDILLAAARSTSGWVRLSSTAIIAPRQIQRLGNDFENLECDVHLLEEGTIVEKQDWISIPATSSVEEARRWIGDMRKVERGRTFLKEGTILGIVDAAGEVSGVVEIEELEWAEEWWGGYG